MVRGLLPHVAFGLLKFCISGIREFLWPWSVRSIESTWFRTPGTQFGWLNALNNCAANSTLYRSVTEIRFNSVKSQLLMGFICRVLRLEFASAPLPATMY